MKRAAEERVKQANRIYEQFLKEKLEKRYRGKIVAIEVESGDYFLGDSEVEAYEKGRKKHPGKTFVYKRVGHEVTHFVRAF